MKNIIVANWKMNPPTIKKAKNIFNPIKKKINNFRNLEIVICPPFLYLPFFHPLQNLKLGAQNCFWEEKGAFTGEISPLMLKKLGCNYVIVGHSEREKHLGETDEMANKKIKAVISMKLNPIFCIGEKWNERKSGKTKKILKEQLRRGLNEISKEKMKKVTIAYEPVWAIGTGNPCDPLEAKKSALLIKEFVAKKYSASISNNLRILYGGSVNSKNAKDFIEKGDFQGFIIGGASLKLEEFIKIVKTLNKKYG